MNKKHEIIDISTFTDFLTDTGDEHIMHTQLYRYLRENSGGIDNRCYITGMFGPFEMDIQQIIRGWYFVTCPGLRIHNQALTLDTAHKICSRFKRRLTYELNRVNGKDYSYIWVHSAKSEEVHGESLDRLYGYWYFDERRGEPRVFMYQEYYDKTFILKVGNMFVYIIDEAGMEHAVHQVDVYDKIMELCHESNETEEVEPQTIWQRIKNFFR